MSTAYTLAWCDVKDTREADLRDKLHDARELLHEIVADLGGRDGIDCTDTSEILGAIQALAYEAAVCDDTLDKERAEWEEEKAKLCKEYDELHAKLDQAKDALEKLEAERDVLKAKLAVIPTEPPPPEPPKPKRRRKKEAEQEIAQSAPAIPPPTAAPKAKSNVIHVDFRKRAGREAEVSAGGETACDLYRRASAIDDDPKRVKEAEALYLKALEIDPSLAVAHTNLGNIFYRTHRKAAAIERWELALFHDGMCPEAHYNLGYAALEAGRPADAANRLQRAVEIDPNFADAHFNLAMALEQLAEPEAAKRAQKHWAAYVRLEPKGTWSDVARRHLRDVETETEVKS
jgi:tetratricopeptide (TPR) repeat protein